jgi:hypothetical protein
MQDSERDQEIIIRDKGTTITPIPLWTLDEDSEQKEIGR